ncbi:MAG: DUF362 domain-containing protein [Pirellulales bacterium]|nr:DUF362 domain-containing protein [Pirellulales bacterium]
MSRRVFLRQVIASGTSCILSSALPATGGSTVWAAESTAAPARWRPDEPPNRPIGTAKGIFPGRVVWIHDPAAARWDGDTKAGGWYEDRFTDPAAADRMLSQTLRALTGANSDSQAWKSLFQQFNQSRARGSAGYQPGEKVAVKLNLNCCKRRVDPTQGFYNTPQLTVALLRQLVRQAGVRPSDLVFYDASRFVPDSIFIPCHAELPDVRFEDRDGGEGRFKVQPDRGAALYFGDPATPSHGKTYLPECLTGATYLINAAVLKGHSLAGVTLCAKNHFGSVWRDDTDPKDPHLGWNPSHLHGSITTTSRPMGTYNSLVDIMGHRHFGGKTVLYLIDGLYASPHQSVLPEKWQSAPFSGHWTASILASQDPVAIESVAVDFCGAEETQIKMTGAVDNYLHEAAMPHKAPSGTRYAPAGDHRLLESLGVHEHWNDPTKRQYSRDLGTGDGIELVKG